jgi:hypothetical protein
MTTPAIKDENPTRSMPQKIILIIIKVIVGGIAGSILEIFFIAIVCGILGFGATLIQNIIESSNLGLQGIIESTYMFVLGMGFWGMFLSCPVGILAGASTLSLRKLRISIIVTIISSMITAIYVYSDPNWYGGVEFRPLGPTITWFSVICTSGILVVLTIYFIPDLIKRKVENWRIYRKKAQP